jgi:hypothetical protein
MVLETNSLGPVSVFGEVTVLSNRYVLSLVYATS